MGVGRVWRMCMGLRVPARARRTATAHPPELQQRALEVLKISLSSTGSCGGGDER